MLDIIVFQGSAFSIRSPTLVNGPQHQNWAENALNDLNIREAHRTVNVRLVRKTAVFLVFLLIRDSETPKNARFVAYLNHQPEY